MVQCNAPVRGGLRCEAFFNSEGRASPYALTWHPDPPPTGCPTATRGDSAATTNDVQNTTARLSVRLSVHPLPTQRCPVIPIHAPHAWDTHWRPYGLMRGCNGRLRTR